MARSAGLFGFGSLRLARIRRGPAAFLIAWSFYRGWSWRPTFLMVCRPIGLRNCAVRANDISPLLVHVKMHCRAVDGLRDITSDRRLAILAVCAVEWHAGIADAVVETHDRIVGKTWQDAKRLCDTRIADAKSALHDTLRSFKALGAALLEAKGDEASLDVATEMSCGWLQLEGLVATAAELTDTMTL